jgi:hypothetical protein
MTEKKRHELRGRTPLHISAGTATSFDEEADEDGPLLTGGGGTTNSPPLVDSHSFSGSGGMGGTPLRNKGFLSLLSLRRKNNVHTHSKQHRRWVSMGHAVWRDVQLQWRVSNTYTRFVISLVLVWMIHYLVWGQLIDRWLARPQSWPVQAIDTKQFVVVINTYKRPDMLRQAVQHYAQTCGPSIGVAQAFVIWAELDVTPPSPSSWLVPSSNPQTSTVRYSKTTLSSSAATAGGATTTDTATVEIIRVTKDSLNSRFLPIHNVASPAIFMVDDDVRVDCTSLRQGFDAWRTNPNAMVGYYPRLALESSSRPGEHIYQAWPGVYWRQSANFMLTKASFLHHKYMTLYSDPTIHPVEILEYVDKYKNCEDVAMSLLVANQTMAMATSHTTTSSSSSSTNILPNIIYVEGHVSDLGLTGGISSSGKAQHFSHRSDCLRDMSAMYTQRGWPVPLQNVRPNLQDITWIRHIPGWSIRPSNFFEWFAFTNMFQS